MVEEIGISPWPTSFMRSQGECRIDLLLLFCFDERVQKQSTRIGMSIRSLRSDMPVWKSGLYFLCA